MLVCEGNSSSQGNRNVQVSVFFLFFSPKWASTKFCCPGLCKTLIRSCWSDPTGLFLCSCDSSALLQSNQAVVFTAANRTFSLICYGQLFFPATRQEHASGQSISLKAIPLSGIWMVVQDDHLESVQFFLCFFPSHCLSSHPSPVHSYC